MKQLIAAIGLVFALSPLAMAQSKVDDKKAAPAVTTESNKAAPAAAKAKKEPSEKQLAHRAKMKTCSNTASEKNFKGDERKQFMSTCLKG